MDITTFFERLNNGFHLKSFEVIWRLTAICLVRAITAVQNAVTALGMVVAGPICTPQLGTLRVI